MCTKCWALLESLYLFRSTCQKNEKLLAEYARQTGQSRVHFVRTGNNIVLTDHDYTALSKLESAVENKFSPMENTADPIVIEDVSGSQDNKGKVKSQNLIGTEE